MAGNSFFNTQLFGTFSERLVEDSRRFLERSGAKLKIVGTAPSLRNVYSYRPSAQPKQNSVALHFINILATILLVSNRNFFQS